MQTIQPHILQKFQVQRKIGNGAYGHVWRVVDRSDGRIFALKKVFDAFQNRTDAQRTYRQVMTLQAMTHDNIIKIEKLYKAENQRDVYLLFQYMQADLLKAIKDGILQQLHKRFIVYQLFKAIKYIHSAQLIHRDLKPSNLLIKSDCTLKVCDFGLVRSLYQQSGQSPVLTDYVATRYYRAPQILLGSSEYTKAVDIWSLGCIIAQLYNKKPIFSGSSVFQQLNRIFSMLGRPSQQDLQALHHKQNLQTLNSIPIQKSLSLKEHLGEAPADVVNLLQKMLVVNPAKRWGIQMLLDHDYVRDFRNKESQVMAEGIVILPVRDSVKLSLKQYRNLIYELDGKDFFTQKQWLLRKQKETLSKEKAKAEAAHQLQKRRAKELQQAKQAQQQRRFIEIKEEKQRLVRQNFLREQLVYKKELIQKHSDKKPTIAALSPARTPLKRTPLYKFNTPFQQIKAQLRNISSNKSRSPSPILPGPPTHSPIRSKKNQNQSYYQRFFKPNVTPKEQKRESRFETKTVSPSKACLVSQVFGDRRNLQGNK